MRVTPPIVITGTKLTSSDATEPHAPSAYASGTTYAIGDIAKVVADYAIYESLAGSNTGNTPSTSPLWWRKIGPTEDAYNSGTTYALGATVSSSTYHRCYESLTANNVGNPLPVPPETTTTYWLDIGPTNKWAMFDFNSNTQTVYASPLDVVVTPGERINTVGFKGVKANSITVSATSVLGGGTVYGPETIDLNTRVVNDGYDYAFEPFSTNPSAVLFDLPPYSDIIVTVTFTATEGNCKCAAMVLGTYIYLGDIKADSGPTNDGLNFSTISRDIYGTATLIPRRTLPKLDVLLTVGAHRANKCQAAKVLLNAIPALWTGLDDSDSNWFDAFSILGVYNKFTINGITEDRAEIGLGVEEI